MRIGQDIFLVQSHPMMEDELLLSTRSYFYTRAFISALETNVIVRPQGICGMRIQAVSATKRKVQ